MDKKFAALQNVYIRLSILDEDGTTYDIKNITLCNISVNQEVEIPLLQDRIIGGKEPWYIVGQNMIIDFLQPVKIEIKEPRKGEDPMD